MALITWQERFCIGIASVDHEHKELITLINQLHESLGGNAAHDDILAFLGQVYSDISAHFALEERVMRECGYERYEAHKEAHEALLDEILDIMDEFEAGHFDNYEDVLSKRLENWFVEHFRTHDAQLHKALGEG